MKPTTTTDMKKTSIPGVTYRSMNVELESTQPTDEQRAAGATEPVITLALSSETPVERYDWWEDERFNEVLDHSPEAVDLSYARDGMPLCLDHDTREQVGILENVRVCPDKKIRGEPRFSRSAQGQDILNDVRDGIRKKVSVGYRIDRTKIDVKSAEKDGDLPTHFIRKWTPMEASMVAIPADYSVGVGRSAGDALPSEVEAAIAVVRQHFPHSLTALKATKERSNMKDSDTAPPGAVTPTVTVKERDEQLSADRVRVSEITKLGRKYGIDGSKVDAWISEGRDVNAVAATILSEMQAKGDVSAPTGRPVVQLTDKERKNYSLQRAINAQVAEKEGRKVDASFEVEVSQDLERHFPSGLERHGGILVPTFTDADAARRSMAVQNSGLSYAERKEIDREFTRAGLDSTTATKGPELKFTVPGDFLDLIRVRMKTMQAGVELLAGLQGPVAFPSQTAAGTASWVGENPGADVAESNLLLSQVALNPKSITSSTSYSRQLLAQSVVDIDGKVKSDLATIIAVALDNAVINGTGAANQPTGILATAGIGSVALGANGAIPTYTDTVDLETKVTAASADLWPTSYLLHPTTRGRFKKSVTLANTIAQAVWTGKGPVGEVNGYESFSTAQVPSNLTKGTAVGICLAIIFGAWSQAVVGDWGMMELIVDPYRLKKQGMIEVTAFAMYGIAVKYPAAFAAIVDALA